MKVEHEKVDQTSNFLHALKKTTYNFSTWIEDFGASDHMTSDISLLTNLFV